MGKYVKLVLVMVLCLGCVFAPEEGTEEGFIGEEYPGIYSLAWSPDGTKIAFVADLNAPNDYQIYIVDVISKEIQQITNMEGIDMQDTIPSWSPDGTRIVFAAAPSGGEYYKKEIYIADLISQQIWQVTNTPGADESQPVWSPDGSAIAFVRTFMEEVDLGDIKLPGDDNVWLMNPDGTNQRQLTRDSGWAPVWSPDGRYLAIATYANDIRRGETGPGGYADIVIITKEGEEVQWLAVSPDPECPLAWSPDGSFILYTRAIGCGIEDFNIEDFNRIKILFRHNLDIPNSLPLTKIEFMNDVQNLEPKYLSNDFGYAPLSPDGSKIVYSPHLEPCEDVPRDGELWVMNSDGTDNHAIVTQILCCKWNAPSLSPQWSPTSDKIAFAGAEYDEETGKRIGPQNIYLVNPDGSGLEQITFFTGFTGYSSAKKPSQEKVLAQNTQMKKATKGKTSDVKAVASAKKDTPSVALRDSLPGASSSSKIARKASYPSPDAPSNPSPKGPYGAIGGLTLLALSYVFLKVFKFLA